MLISDTSKHQFDDNLKIKSIQYKSSMEEKYFIYTDYK